MRKKKEPLAPLLAALGDLVAWLEAAHISGVIIGGVAASLLGRPRVTRDVDALVLVSEERWKEFLKLGTRHGFHPRRKDALAFAHKARVLLVTHKPSSIDADIVFGALPFEEEAIARALWVEVAGVRVPLPLPEDLVIMKPLPTGRVTWEILKPYWTQIRSLTGRKCADGCVNSQAPWRCLIF